MKAFRYNGIAVTNKAARIIEAARKGPVAFNWDDNGNDTDDGTFLDLLEVTYECGGRIIKLEEDIGTVQQINSTNYRKSGFYLFFLDSYLPLVDFSQAP